MYLRYRICPDVRPPDVASSCRAFWLDTYWSHEPRVIFPTLRLWHFVGIFRFLPSPLSFVSFAASSIFPFLDPVRRAARLWMYCQDYANNGDTICMVLYGVCDLECRNMLSLVRSSYPWCREARTIFWLFLFINVLTSRILPSFIGWKNGMGQIETGCWN